MWKRSAVRFRLTDFMWLSLWRAVLRLYERLALKLSLLRLSPPCLYLERLYYIFANQCLAEKGQPRLEQCRCIIIVRLDRLGDAVMFAPYLRDIRNSAPCSNIILVCSPCAWEIYSTSPYLNQVIVLDTTPVWDLLDASTSRRYHHLRRAVKSLCLRHLAPLKPDLLLSPRFDADGWGAFFFSVYSGARFSMAFSEHVTLEKARLNTGHDLVWSRVVHAHGIKHEVERNAEFLTAAGIPAQPRPLALWPNEEHHKKARHMLGNGHSSNRFIAIAPGASEQRKCWPAEFFAKLIQQIKSSNTIIIVIGHASETELCRRVIDLAGSLNVINLCGQTSPLETLCVLQLCALLVCNDSGPAHLAAAAGIPVLVISSQSQSAAPGHFNDPARFHPWGVPHQLLQPEHPLPPCTTHCASREAHCIRQITVEKALEAMQIGFFYR